MTRTLELIDALRRRPVSSRTQLQHDTGLSPASISRALAQLRRKGLIVEGVGAVNGVGRPPRVVRFQPSAAHVIGIDAGGAHIRVLVTDLEGMPLGSRAVTVRATRRIDPLIEAIGDAVRALVRETGATPVAAAAGISGIVDPTSGTVLLSPDLPGLNGHEVGDLLSQELSMPVGIENDDLLAAVGEAAFGAAEGCTSVVFLSLGHGLGAGLLVDGRPVRGARSAAGAIAYAAPGRLEDRASGRSIPLRLAERQHRTTKSGPRLNAEAVFAMAEGGDPAAADVIADALEGLGDLAINIASLMDPEVIVLGGGMARGQPRLVDELSDRVRAALPFPPRVTASRLGEQAVARGAASLALTLGHRRLTGAAPGPGRLGSLEFA